MIHFIKMGNLKLCQYLFSRGADCQKIGILFGLSPMLIATRYSYFKIIQWLYHDGGTHHDITRTCVVNAENKDAYRWNTIPYYSCRKES